MVLALAPPLKVTIAPPTVAEGLNVPDRLYLSGEELAGRAVIAHPKFEPIPIRRAIRMRPLQGGIDEL